VQDLSEFYDPEVGIFEYLVSIPQLTVCLWGNLFVRPDQEGHEFQDLNFKFKFPQSLIEMRGIYRLVKMEYDHLSDSCMSYFPLHLDNALKRCMWKIYSFLLEKYFSCIKIVIFSAILEWVELHKKMLGELEGLQSPEASKTVMKSASLCFAWVCN